ncbi:MAG: hypothetical protein ACOCXQ_02445 [Patescibacteria group bacterium]
MNIKALVKGYKKQKYIFRVVLFVVIAAVTAVAFYRFFLANSGNTRASSENAVITTSAQKNQVTLEEQIDITSRIDIPSSQNAFLAGVDLIITYDPAKVDVSGYEISDSSLEQILIDEQIEPGKFRLMAGSTKSASDAKSNVTLTFSFTPKTVGTAQFEIEQQSFAAIGGQGTSATAVTYGPSDNGRTASVTISGGTPTDEPAEPTDVPPTDIPPTDVPPTDIPPTDEPAEPTDVPPTDEPAEPTSTPDDCPRNGEGDANCDEIVDSIDYVIWRKVYLEEPVNDSYDPDYNDDSEVNLLDNQIWTDTFITQ